jgi:flavin reductase (DIM6/NTAB) family NADH-FMN oxidoreductase RutF
MTADFHTRISQVSHIDAGDHRLVVGRVLNGAIVSPAGVPLIYAQIGNLDGSESLYSATFS